MMIHFSKEQKTGIKMYIKDLYKNKKSDIKRGWVIVFLITQVLSGGLSLSAQKTGADSVALALIMTDSGERVNPPYVYLDCDECDYDYIRSELTFVNYVRDPKMADIHVFVTDENITGGGKEFQFSFIGRRDFEGTEYSMKHKVNRNATKTEERKALARFLTLGFASYMLQTPLANLFSVSYIGEDYGSKQQGIEDPWNYWVFQAYIGSIEMELESNKSIFDSRWGFYADRVTDKWKLRIRPYFNFDRISIQTSERDEPVISKQRRHGLDSYAILSINDHWSTGIFGTYRTYNGANLKHEAMMSPGIEYSLFPYQIATRRSITLTYNIGFGYNDYFEETIYNKTEEGLFNHQVKGEVSIQQPWGNIETGLVGSQYFHDLSRRRIEFFGQTSVRLFKGFFLSFQAEYNVIRDQISLPKGEASLEEVLLKQRELATDFSFSSSIAVSYTFGSKYANIVNTRF